MSLPLEGQRIAVPSQSDISASPTSREPILNYGWYRIFLCYLLPPLLAKALGARRRRYVEAFLWLDIALLVTNVVIDRGPREGLRRLPEEMGLWPTRQERHRPLS